MAARRKPAMEIHGMTTQPQLVVMVSTPKPRRSVTALGVELRFVRCRRRHLFGLTDHWATKQERVRVSDLERAAVTSGAPISRPMPTGSSTPRTKPGAFEI